MCGGRPTVRSRDPGEGARPPAAAGLLDEPGLVLRGPSLGSSERLPRSLLCSGGDQGVLAGGAGSASVWVRVPFPEWGSVSVAKQQPRAVFFELGVWPVGWQTLIEHRLRSDLVSCPQGVTS